MANFFDSFNVVMMHEGGYDNDPLDPGGETYKGISRKFHPDWPGWWQIDKIKNTPQVQAPGDDVQRRSLDVDLEHDASVQQAVVDFYKQAYWIPLFFDQIEDDTLATKIFDSCILMGVKPAIKLLQEAINVLSAVTGVPEIKEDGLMGPKTMVAINTHTPLTAETLVKVYAKLQEKYYEGKVQEVPTKKKFLNGWEARARWPYHTDKELTT